MRILKHLVFHCLAVTQFRRHKMLVSGNMDKSDARIDRNIDSIVLLNPV